MSFAPIISMGTFIWLQSEINRIFTSWGSEEHRISVRLINYGWAYASGTNPSLFGVPDGSILINPFILKIFTREELRFILAHECAHIFENHQLARILYDTVENFVASLINNPNSRDFIRIVVSVLNGILRVTLEMEAQR